MQRVLVVDDDRLVADTLTLIFERNGFTAKAAYSADEALESSREFGPDLLLCDVLNSKGVKNAGAEGVKNDCSARGYAVVGAVRAR